jgi:RecA-family ATPase
VTATPVKWLWPGYIPLGKLTMADGDPDLGKTTVVAADLAARVTRGWGMPNEGQGLEKPAGVVLFTAEDDPSDTLKPRLVAAGGDPERMLVVQTIISTDENGKTVEWQPTFDHLEVIEKTITEMDAKLVIFDPFMSYLPSAVNSYRDQDVRSALAPLARLAAKLGVAVVLIRHLNKNGAVVSPLYRGGGSIGIIGAARSGLLIAKDPDDENTRVLSISKLNVGKKGPSLAYTIEKNENGESYVVWRGESEHQAADLLGLHRESDTQSKFTEAVDLLREQLASGPRVGDDLKLAAKSARISPATLRRAEVWVGVVHKKAGRTGPWMWSLPNTPEGAHQPDDDYSWEF